MIEGWISLHRKVKEHWLWKDPVKFQWWIDVLLSVNTSDIKINLGNELVECKRGQSIKSLQTWASDWKTTKDTVRNFFKLLEKDKMVLLENIKKSTRLTVCNYDSYQGGTHASRTQPKRNPNATQTQPHPNNKDNKDNKEYIHSGFEFVGISAPDEKEIRVNQAPVKKVYSFEDKYNFFISQFNHYTGRQFRGDNASKDNLKARLKEGYTSADLKTAIKNCLADEYHQQHNFKDLTPEFITRSDKLEKYLNATPAIEQPENKGCGIVSITREEREQMFGGGRNPDFVQPDYTQPDYKLKIA